MQVRTDVKLHAIGTDTEIKTQLQKQFLLEIVQEQSLTYAKAESQIYGEVIDLAQFADEESNEDLPQTHEDLRCSYEDEDAHGDEDEEVAIKTRTIIDDVMAQSGYVIFHVCRGLVTTSGSRRYSRISRNRMAPTIWLTSSTTVIKVPTTASGAS